MSAYHIHENAPLGSLIRSGVGARQPAIGDDPAAMALRNGAALLVRKDPPQGLSGFLSPSSITLRFAEFGTRGMAGVTILLTGPGADTLRLEIARLPPIGAVRILRQVGGDIELLHLAEDPPAAEAWLRRHPDLATHLETVTADEVGAAIIEGRAAR